RSSMTTTTTIAAALVFAGRIFRTFLPSHRLNGVQEVAGSNPVAPTSEGQSGPRVPAGLFSILGLVPTTGQSCGQRFERSASFHASPRHHDRRLLSSTPRPAHRKQAKLAASMKRALLRHK